MSGQPTSKITVLAFVVLLAAVCFGGVRACYRTLHPPVPMQKLGEPIR